MAYGNPHKKGKMYKSKSRHNSGNSTQNAAKGVKTPYDGSVGQRQAYKITGKVVDQ